MAGRYKLLWTGPAIEDLRQIRDYVSLDKPLAAKKLAKSIRAKVGRLKEHPGSGRLVPELAGLGYREVIVPPYRIVYQVQKKRVVILRVWHGRRPLGRPAS